MALPLFPHSSPTSHHGQPTVMDLHKSDRVRERSNLTPDDNRLGDELWSHSFFFTPPLLFPSPLLAIYPFCTTSSLLQFFYPLPSLVPGALHYFPLFCLFQRQNFSSLCFSASIGDVHCSPRTGITPSSPRLSLSRAKAGPWIIDEASMNASVPVLFSSAARIQCLPLGGWERETDTEKS